jgi:7SK snRNA methylphosphate capping enzyme
VVPGLEYHKLTALQAYRMSQTTKNCGPLMGNYHGYYKMRTGSNHRIELLEQRWFTNLSCLDVGCNDGQLCMSIAETFQPNLILGIDVDHVLIDSAKSKVKRAVYSVTHTTSDQATTAVPSVPCGQVVPKPYSYVAFKPRSVVVKETAFATTVVAMPATHAGAAVSASAHFPYNVKFKAADIFDLSCTVAPCVEGRYDVVTCFSVTKWVHLNGGDARLLSLFCRLYSLARRGGRVIIEYQPWKSYENNKNTSEQTKQGFREIRIKPDMFEWALTRLVGFEIEGRRGPPLEQAKGFDRPILVLRRPEEFKGTVDWAGETGISHLLAGAYQQLDIAPEEGEARAVGDSAEVKAVQASSFHSLRNKGDPASNGVAVSQTNKMSTAEGNKRSRRSTADAEVVESTVKRSRHDA